MSKIANFHQNIALYRQKKIVPFFVPFLSLKKIFNIKLYGIWQSAHTQFINIGDLFIICDASLWHSPSVITSLSAYRGHTGHLKRDSDGMEQERKEESACSLNQMSRCCRSWEVKPLLPLVSEKNREQPPAHSSLSAPETHISPWYSAKALTSLSAYRGHTRQIQRQYEHISNNIMLDEVRTNCEKNYYADDKRATI